MKYQLINSINPKYSTIETILTNRGVPIQEVQHYLTASQADVNPPEALGSDNLFNAATCLMQHFPFNEEKVLVIVDCDCDGFTAAALLLNYLHDLFPS